MNYWNLKLVAIGLLILISDSQLHASSYHDFLRINKVYVLYTDPIVPHRDTAGNFWIGLEPFTLLIGAKFKESTDGSASVNYHGHSFVFSDGAMTASFDGKSLPLPVAAKLIGMSHQMVVPLVPLLKAMRLHYQWDNQFHILTLTDPDLLNQGTAGDFVQQIAEFEGPPMEPIAPARLFVGPPYPISPLVPPEITQNGSNLIWKLHNLSAKDFPEIDVNLLLSGQHGEELIKSGIPFPASFPNPPLYDSIKANSTLEYKISVKDQPTYSNHGDPIHSPGGGTVTIIPRPVVNILAWLVM